MIPSKNIDVNINLNKFLKDFSSKKQYFKKVNDHVKTLSHLKQKGYRSLNKYYLWSTPQNEAINEHVVMYIIDITFSRSNTFLHVMDSKGQLKFFASAGHFKYKGKNKKFRFNVLKSIYKVLLTKLKYLKNKPIALHLKNVGFNKFSIIKKLKTKFFIKTVKVFNLFPFNGCRNKKIRRKKMKTKRRNG
jgi:ribosomal protein S11